MLPCSTILKCSAVKHFYMLIGVTISYQSISKAAGNGPNESSASREQFHLCQIVNTSLEEMFRTKHLLISVQPIFISRFRTQARQNDQFSGKGRLKSLYYMLCITGQKIASMFQSLCRCSAMESSASSWG